MRGRGPGQVLCPDSRGFGLLALLMWMVIITSVSLALAIRLFQHSGITGDLERQLYSHVLAVNGIEVARAILPEVDLNQLILGQDGVFQGSHFREWRNPLPFDAARSVDPTTWSSPRDDGIPLLGPGPAMTLQSCRSNGFFALRITNNPEEAADLDEDHVVVVRSMGITTGTVTFDLFPRVRNCVTVVEARFRQERTFGQRSAVTLLGTDGDFQWSGASFSISGGESPAIAVLELAGTGLLQDVQDSLTDLQRMRISGEGVTGSIVDSTLLYQLTPILRAAYSSRFWQHFQDQLPAFSGGETGILYFPAGGSFSGSHRGILVALRDFSLRGSANLEGLLIHLGQGGLLLEGEAIVKGGLWMSNLESSTGNLAARPIQLSVSDQSKVVFDSQALNDALTCFPPTLLSWRILSPEMIQ